MKRAHGFDMAGSYETLTDAKKVFESGMRFAIHKASEGIGYADPKYAGNSAELKKNGLILIAYHYFRPKYDALQQAEWFWQCIKGTPFDAVMVDWETTDNIVPAGRVINWVIAFARRIRELTGKPVVLYSGMWFLRQYVQAELEKLKAEMPLFINAAYWWEKKTGFDDTEIMALIENPEAYPFWPDTAPFDAWGWQWTARGKIAGIEGACDRDIAFGTLRELAGSLGIELPGEQPGQPTFEWAVYRFLKTLGYEGPEPNEES